MDGKTIDETLFICVYGPEANDDSSYYRLREWTNAEDWAEIQRLAPERKVWTLVDDSEGGTAILSGLHYVNRLGYILAEHPYAEDATITVYDEDELDDAEAEEELLDEETEEEEKT